MQRYFYSYLYMANSVCVRCRVSCAKYLYRMKSKQNDFDFEPRLCVFIFQISGDFPVCYGERVIKIEIVRVRC